jgi:hypothetical protein
MEGGKFFLLHSGQFTSPPPAFLSFLKAGNLAGRGHGGKTFSPIGSIRAQTSNGGR